MTEHDDLDRRLARWFEADALGPAPAGRFQQTIDRTRNRRPRSALLAGFGSHWVETGLAADAPRVSWRSIAVIVLVALAIAAGGLIAGAQPFRRDPVDILTNRAFVEPYIGLPPDGVAPSTPETGQLVLSFNGRLRGIGDFHRLWLFADGRLVWKRNLDHINDAGKRAFGAIEPTTAVIEQHLAPEGIELMRSRVMAAGLTDFEPVGTGKAGEWGRPGVLWGGLEVRDGDRLVEASWSDSELPALLADPASWIPASAWGDQRLRAYVPSRYAICLRHGVPAGVPAVGSSEIWDLLPEPIRNLIRSRALEDPVPDWNERDPGCLYQVSTDDARAITAALDDAGLQRDSGNPLIYAGIEVPSNAWEGHVELLVVLPNGEVVCECG